ncbi:MAG: hypothetical protein H0U67_05890 [Gemmatimonadetes bacterium]|nr:hypothetical protein [Gemmatimonadota bacterium]MBA4157781.1 hypothetical protein [Gemmatimonadota bacterium]
MSVSTCFALLGAYAVLIAGFGFRRYGTLLNPLTIFATLSIGVFTLMSGVVTWVLVSDFLSEDAFRNTALLSAVYLTGVTVPYLFRGPVPAMVFGKLLHLLQLDHPAIARRFDPVKLILLLCGAFVALSLLAVVGGGGTLWVTSPRYAYLTHRAGAGQFWLLAQWFLMCGWIYFLWSWRPKISGVIVGVFVFSVFAYFTGSKSAILTLAVIAVVYYNFTVRHIRMVPLIGLGACGIVGILGLLVLQGSYADFVLALAYFDYFGTTAHFIHRFDEFGLYYGRAWLSSFWFYVPRGFYADKPYEYGTTLIHAVLYPGAAEAGHTPGFLNWTMAYLDFGALGVFFSGVVVGFWPRMAYEYYLRHRDQFFAFMFMIQLAIWPVLTFAPFSTVVVWSVVLSLFFRLVWSRTRSPFTGDPLLPPPSASASSASGPQPAIH